MASRDTPPGPEPLPTLNSDDLAQMLGRQQIYAAQLQRRIEELTAALVELHAEVGQSRRIAPMADAHRGRPSTANTE